MNMTIWHLLQPSVVVPWLLGMVFGIFVGSTPGLTATMAVALIVPISFHMDPAAGLAMIIGVSFTAIFAGDIPATYLRIPGTPASAAATLDGHEMARQGKARLALLLDLYCSALGGLFGVAMLIVVAPQLARFALRFSNFEYFWLGISGLGLSVLVSRGSTLRGMMSAVLGILLSTVGPDVISFQSRYTFGSDALLGGLRFIPAMIGVFGLSEVLRNVEQPQLLAAPSAGTQHPASLMETLSTIWRHKWTVLQSAITGTMIGALPGAGADIAAWGAYGVAQKTSRRADRFGTGCEEGVIAPTSANNAAVGAAWIPALVFGVPGDAVTAIVLGALLMYGIETGSKLFEQQEGPGQLIFGIALITQLLLIPAGLLGIRAFGLIMRLPRRTILIGVLLFSVVGSFALYNSALDVYVMFAFGLLGYYLESQRVPLAPLILGMILGPIVEDKLRSGLVSTGGDLIPMFTRPICATFIFLLLIAFLSPLLAKLAMRKKAPSDR